MFELTQNEYEALRTQFAASNYGRGGRRYLPMAFTEQGVTMLSCILNSERAIGVNIQIIRIFTKLRESLINQKDILLQLEKMETKLAGHDAEILLIFKYLKQMLSPQQPPRRRIGFRRKDQE